MRRAGLLVGLSVAVACGGEDGPNRQAYVDEAVVWIQEDDDEVEVTDAQAACLAEAIVDAVGVDQLDDAGVSPEDLRSMEMLSDVGIELSSSSVEDLSGRISGCDIDVSGTFIDAMTAELSSGAALSRSRRVASPTSSAPASRPLLPRRLLPIPRRRQANCSSS